MVKIEMNNHSTSRLEDIVIHYLI